MLNTEQIQNIEAILKSSLRSKFSNYNPEPAKMPFHTKLLGADRMALFSFIHSLNTNFGTTIFEPVALELSRYKFQNSSKQFIVGDTVSEDALYVIQDIMENLRSTITSPNKISEIERIRSVCQKGKMREIKPTKVDLFFQNNEGGYYLFDIKTAKPNKGGFQGYKRTLLEWVAVILAKEPQANVYTGIAIPYNPYEPKPYSRWTMAGMLDLKNELKVAEEFWDFLGGEGAYNDLLRCFERVGIELRDEIDNYFSKYLGKNR